MAAFEGAPEELDQTVMPAGGAVAEAVDAALAALVKRANGQRQFTDTATFALRCIVCREGLKGQKEAAAHALATGHASFGEY